MGLDFIRKATPAFEKGIDRSRIRLATPTFFTEQPKMVPRVYSARLLDDNLPFVGEMVSVSLRDGRVLLLRGIEVLGVLRDPPAALKDALTASFGEACGTVQEIHELSGTAEVTVC